MGRRRKGFLPNLIDSIRLLVLLILAAYIAYILFLYVRLIKSPVTGENGWEWKKLYNFA